jgi:hypothetical protein
MTSVLRLAGPAALAVSMIVTVAAEGRAQQQEFFPYYGKNKVIYEQFAWKSYATDHFQIFYYADDARTLRDVAATAESGYRKISDGLKHEIAEPVPSCSSRPSPTSSRTTSSRSRRA